MFALIYVKRITTYHPSIRANLSLCEMSANSHKRTSSGASEVQNRVYGKPPLDVHIPNLTRKTLGKIVNQVHEQAAAATSATTAEEAGPP